MNVELVRESLKKVFPPGVLSPTSEQMGEYLNADEFIEHAAGRTWLDFDSAFLERHHDALIFFKKEIVPSYLPAYLLALVRREHVLDALPVFTLGLLTREEPATFEARFSSLSAEQRRAIANVLAAYEADVQGTGRQVDVTRALDSYWRKFAGGGL